MADKIEATRKQIVIQHWDGSKKYMMAPNEYVGVVVGKEATDGEYIISDGVMAPGGAVPDHYHKWEDQTFHILQGTVDAKIGDTWVSAGAGDTIHCPRGVSHYMKNNSDQTVRMISYIFPGDRAEAFMAETSRQNEGGEQDFELIEREFGVVYL